MSLSDDFVEPLHDLADARAEGAVLRQSVLVLHTSLRHLAFQFLVFATALLALGAFLVVSAIGLHPLLGDFREWVPGLCLVLTFGACAFLVQYLRVRQLNAGTEVVLREIERSVAESHVVVEKR
jgi:hypothetical protein